MTGGDGIEHKRRSCKLSLAFGFALFLYGVSLPVAGALGRGVEPWMVPMTLLMIGSAIYMILQAIDRSLAAIVVGLGLASVAFLFNFGRAAVRLATEPPRLPNLVFNLALLLLSGALLAYVVPYVRRSYRSAQSPPAV